MKPLGPPDAPIAIICDYPSSADRAAGFPLSDYAGKLFFELLTRRGILKNSCFITSVLQAPVRDDDITVHLSGRKTCPSPEWRNVNGKWVSAELAEGLERVRAELELVKPRLVITLGELALWGLTGSSGVSRWRGSRLGLPQWPFTIVPCLAPRGLVRDLTLSTLFQIDLGRAKAIFDGQQLPRDYRFHIAPSFELASTVLDYLITQTQHRADDFPLSLDLETRAGHMACIGLAWSPEDAICLPLITTDDSKPFFYTEEEEAILVWKISRLLRHPRVLTVGQNIIYDCQYLYRHWGFLPARTADTMIGHHSIYANMRKGLDFLSAMYAQDHVYWKDESKEWDPKLGEKQYWTYNCLASNTPVLLANLTYKPLGEITVGEKLFTFEEIPSGSRYARAAKIAIVTKTAKATKPVHRYKFSDGTYLDATDDHKILTTVGRDSRSNWQWREMKDLSLGDRVASFGKPWKPVQTFEAGWLSGIFDGEGTVGFANANKGYAPNPRLSFSQKAGPVLEKAKRILQDYGFSCGESEKRNANYVDIQGGFSEQVRFLGLFQPIRLLKNFHKYSYCEGLSGFAGLGRPTLVEKVFLGTQEVADITTTEGTFIANGIFVHNCKDACITWEIWEEITITAKRQGVDQHFAFQQSLFFPVLRMMNRGIRIDTSQKARLRDELVKAQFERQEKLDYLAGHPLNPQSPSQLSKFFYDDLGIPGVKNLAGDGLTTNSPAMQTIALRQPILKPLCQLIVELRSIGVFLGTFIDARLDSDGRMRCSFNIAGTETFRFSSSENAFGSGMNLQNIPVKEKAKIKSADYIALPNIRKLFIPDPGYTFFDIDLDRADLQVVIWEADDADMKAALRMGLDMHCVNACDVFDIKGIPYDELRENHPNYPEHRGRIGEANRGKTKAGVHATNYGVGDRKLAQTLGISVVEAARFRAKWFAAHPGIRKWHLRTEESATRRGFIENRFGARIYTFGRIDLPQLLGWLPQSTVAGVINRALTAIDGAEQRGETSIQLLIQVHDSLAGQFLTSRKAQEVETLKRLAQVVVPYEEPLIIPIGVKLSEVSWGDCK